MYSAVPEGDDGADMADLKASLGDAVVKIGMGAAMKNKWLRKEGTVLKSLRLEDGTVVKGKVFIAGTYEGDLMARSGTSFTWGREANTT